LKKADAQCYDPVFSLCKRSERQLRAQFTKFLLRSESLVQRNRQVGPRKSCSDPPLTVPSQCCGAARRSGRSSILQHFVSSNVGVRDFAVLGLSHVRSHTSAARSGVTCMNSPRSSRFQDARRHASLQPVTKALVPVLGYFECSHAIGA
jgi:hypothetical protein